MLAQGDAASQRERADSLRVRINASTFPEKASLLTEFYKLDEVWIFEEDEMRWVNEGLAFYKNPKTMKEREHLFSLLKMRSYYYSRQNDYENMTKDVVVIQEGISKIVEPTKLLLGIKAKTKLFMAQNSFSRGDVEASIENVNQAIAVFKVLKDTYNIAQSLKALSVRYNGIGDHDKALSLIEESILMFKQLGAESELLRAQNSIASIYMDANKWNEAQQVLLANLPKMEATQHPSLGYTLTDLAWVASKLGDYKTGLEYIAKAKPFVEASGSKHMKIVFFETAAEVEEGANHLKEALFYQKKYRDLQFAQNQDLIKAAQIESSATSALDEKIAELESRIKVEKQQTLKKTGLAMLATAFLSAFFFFLFYQKKEKENKLVLVKMQTILDEKENEPDQSKELTLVWNEESNPSSQGNDLGDADLFLKFFTAKVQKQLSDPSLTVEGLADQMKISRVALFNRVKTSTNGSAPSTLIRMIRLETARRILESEQITVAEVADRVGFKTTSSFSRSFKKQFGVSPSETPTKE